jgi:hypothetical protein
MKYNILKFFSNDINFCERIRWYERYPSFRIAWDDCLQGDFMIEMAIMMKVDHRKIVLALGRSMLILFPYLSDHRSETAVQNMIEYGKDNASRNILRRHTDKEFRALPFSPRESYAASTAVAHAVDASIYSRTTPMREHASIALEIADSISAFSSTISYTNDDGIEIMRPYSFATADICREILTESVMKIVGEE